MRVIQVTATAGADGRLRLDIPTGVAGANFDVAVVLHGSAGTNGTGHRPSPVGSLASLYGSVTDNKFVAPERGMPREVPSLDTV